jgi:hypothetical protein
MDRYGRRQIGAVARQFQDIAAAKAKAHRGAAFVDQAALAGLLKKRSECRPDAPALLKRVRA